MASAGARFLLLKPLLDRCLSLHAEDRPTAAEAMRALERLRGDPCVYRPAGHGAGVLADRWFKVTSKGAVLDCKSASTVFISTPADMGTLSRVEGDKVRPHRSFTKHPSIYSSTRAW